MTLLTLGGVMKEIIERKAVCELCGREQRLLPNDKMPDCCPTCESSTKSTSWVYVKAENRCCPICSGTGYITVSIGIIPCNNCDGEGIVSYK